MQWVHHDDCCDMFLIVRFVDGFVENWWQMDPLQMICQSLQIIPEDNWS